MLNKQQNEQSVVSPEILVRYYKFYRQQTNPYVKHEISFERIRTTSMYKTNKKLFDKLSFICTKYGIDYVRYIRYCVLTEHIREPYALLQLDNIRKYAAHLKLHEQYKKIYEYYMKTVDYISDECIRTGLNPENFILSLTSSHKLAFNFMAGNISQYFLVTIPGFKDFFDKLDDLSKEEMRIIYDAYDTLLASVNESFLLFKNQKPDPISIVNNKINQKLNNN